MMAASGMIRTGFTLFGDPDNPMEGVSDVVVTETTEGVFLSVASEARSAVSVFDISDPAAVTLTSRIDYGPDTGTSVLSQILVVDQGTLPYLMTFGRYDDNIGYFNIAADGTLSSGIPLSSVEGAVPDAWRAETAAIDGMTYLFAVEFGVSGLVSYQLDGSGGAERVGGFQDNSWRLLGDVTALEAARLHDTELLFTGAAFDAGLHAMVIIDDGGLRIRDKMQPREGEGFARITDISEAVVGDRAFIIVASSQSDTLTVIRVSQGIQMNVVDQVRDTKALRLEGVQVVEVFEAEGRVFVIAGGADDGLSLFELNYRGRLVHLETVVDGFDTTLRNISSLDVRVDGDTAHVYVGSSVEHGVTELIIDLARGGQELFGDAVKDTLTGTKHDDIIWGRGKSDLLEGRRGDDRLIDGRGRDTLEGGQGADIFEFVKDGRTDYILDFEIGVDRIDLSDFEFINHIDDLTIGTRKKGAAIIVGDEVIRLLSANETPIDVGGIDADSFIFG